MSIYGIHSADLKFGDTEILFSRDSKMHNKHTSYRIIMEEVRVINVTETIEVEITAYLNLEQMLQLHSTLTEFLKEC